MDAGVRRHPPAAAGQESREALVVRKLLRSVGIREGDYDPLVLHQFVEVARRYAGDVLVEARAYADHAGRVSLAADDVRLAIQAKAMLSPAPPRREAMLDLARNRNTVQLLRSSVPHGSIRLPPLQDIMLSENYLCFSQIKPPLDQVEETEVADEGSNPKPSTEVLFASRPGSGYLAQAAMSVPGTRNLTPENAACLKQYSEEAKQTNPESSGRTSKKQKQKQQPSQRVSATGARARRRRVKS